MRPALLAALLLAPAAAMADEVTGTILAYDRVAGVIVFEDRTVWAIGAVEVPEGLEAGDVVTIDFTSAGDSGIGRANAVTLDD